ncbi:hypothetical protein BGZ49_010811 [Haplosporangium sp. Z 27]|nr:hypothetical protein BGZ49_010811 [Haplosporangium sp. Z 27]
MESWNALEDLYHAKKLRAIGVSNYTLTHLTQLVERPLYVGHSYPEHHVTQTADTATSALVEGARTMVIPHVHQFELHPRLLQKDIIQYCQNHKIQVQAYSSLGEGRLVSQKPPAPPPMDAHYNAAPMPGALDVMPDLIRKYFPSPSREDDHNNVSKTAAETDVNMDVDLGNVAVVEDDESKQKEYSKRAAQILLRWGLQHGAVVIPKSTHPERIKDNIDLFNFEIDSADMNLLDAYSAQGERTRYCWDPTGVY